MHQRKLLALKCGSDLVKFHDEFTTAAAAALPIMGERWVREHYLAQVQPPELAPLLRVRETQSLQQLMSLALDLEVDLKRQKYTRPTFTHPTTTTPQNPSRGPNGIVQNPNRKPCEKCGRWKFMWDACTNCG